MARRPRIKMPGHGAVYHVVNRVSHREFKLGLQMTEISNRSVASTVQLDNWGGISEPGFISDILVRSSIARQFDELSGHEHPDLQTEYFTAALADLQDKAEAAYVLNGGTVTVPVLTGKVTSGQPKKRWPFIFSTAGPATSVACPPMCAQAFATKRRTSGLPH